MTTKRTKRVLRYKPLTPFEPPSQVRISTISALAGLNADVDQHQLYLHLPLIDRDDAEALDKGVRASELGDIYFSPEYDPTGKGPAASFDWLAKKGDPSWYPGRQTRVEVSGAPAEPCTSPQSGSHQRLEFCQVSKLAGSLTAACRQLA